MGAKAYVAERNSLCSQNDSQYGINGATWRLVGAPRHHAPDLHATACLPSTSWHLPPRCLATSTVYLPNLPNTIPGPSTYAPHTLWTGPPTAPFVPSLIHPLPSASGMYLLMGLILLPVTYVYFFPGTHVHCMPSCSLPNFSHTRYTYHYSHRTYLHLCTHSRYYCRVTIPRSGRTTCCQTSEMPRKKEAYNIIS